MAGGGEGWKGREWEGIWEGMGGERPFYSANLGGEAGCDAVVSPLLFSTSDSMVCALIKSRGRRKRKRRKGGVTFREKENGEAEDFPLPSFKTFFLEEKGKGGKEGGLQKFAFLPLQKKRGCRAKEKEMDWRGMEKEWRREKMN